MDIFGVTCNASLISQLTVYYMNAFVLLTYDEVFVIVKGE